MKRKANIIVFTQNLILESLKDIVPEINQSYPIVLVTSQCLFENEKETIQSLIGEFESYTFASFLSDKEMEKCDQNSYKEEQNNRIDYYDIIKQYKNNIIISKIMEIYVPVTKFILCEDLGIDLSTWIQAGYKKIELMYYCRIQEEMDTKKGSKLAALKRYIGEPVYSAYYNRKKYVFYGSLNRVGYRMGIEFKLDKMENWIFVITVVMSKIFKRFICRKNVEHISTIHESVKWSFPDLPNYKVGIIQDGYLPPDNPSLYLKFVNPNECYYAWDTLGMQIFHNQGILVRMLPFRKKLYMPKPIFKPIKSVLCVASGAGDWTAMKNRSDEDMMIIAFVEIAKRHPWIRFIYRCHPGWVHPEHQGVNSINRVAEYFEWLELPNLILSGNIPSTDIGNFRLSFSRNSLEEDLKEADIVFGEHSIAMIDAAFKGIPFASVNMTGRRDFFSGMTKLGFPHCESLDEIEETLFASDNPEFIDKYTRAVERYNSMTDEE